MERNNIAVVKNGNTSQIAIDKGEQNTGGVLGWWYRYFAPTEPPATASLAQREKARRGRMASLAVLIMILFLLTMLPGSIAGKDFMPIADALVGIGTCFLALFLNRRGLVGLAGVLILIQFYSGQVFSFFTQHGGLTVGNLGSLDFTVIPDILVLAFFPASSLLLIVCINIIMTAVIVLYGPHDATITSLLYHQPQQIFARPYVLQLLTAAGLYLWARSTEQSLKRADRAEEIVTLEKRENERQQRELDQKRKLDAGVQQILQTLVAAANGDLKARAPLSQDHLLWQISVALNNLIARLQSSTLVERALQKQIAEEGKQATGKMTRLEPGGASERVRKQQIREENEGGTGARTNAEGGKLARPEQDDIVEHSPRQQIPVKRKWTVVDTGEGKVVCPEPDGLAERVLAERVRKRNKGADSSLPDPDRKSPS